jgi:trehalose 6-phosphate phosphatase
MKPLTNDFDFDRFFARLSRAEVRALLLDYDGTLAPFHADPRLAMPYPEVAEVLRRVAGSAGTRIVIVSGRRLEDLRGPLAVLPHAEVWASHGWEWSGRGQVDRHVPAKGAREMLVRARALVQPLLALGARLETKVASLALHWRGLQSAVSTRVHSAALEAWEPFDGGELTLLPFDGGLEIRARGHDKGDAVRAVMSTSPGAVAAYLGDDTTDEDAFRAIRSHGLGVLVRKERRLTNARLWLSTPAEVTAFLERWVR